MSLPRQFLHLLAGTAALLVLIAPTSVAAQHRFSLEARAGGAVPAGELAELDAPGAQVGGGVGVRLHPRVALRVDFDASFLRGGKELESGARSPGVSLRHTIAGLEAVVGAPRLRDVPLTVSVNAGAGRTLFDTEAFVVPFNRPEQGGQPFRITERYPTANAGVRASSRVSRRLDLVLSGQGFVTFTDEEDTALLALLSDEIESFGTAWSFPVSVGVRVGL